MRQAVALVGRELDALVALRAEADQEMVRSIRGVDRSAYTEGGAAERHVTGYLALVESFKIPGERHTAMAAFSAGVGARQTRGKKLSSEKIEALIWGLSHTNASVRRCCLELLDTHPSEKAIPHIVARLDDPVPRVRWHAVHAIRCDVCKAGSSFLTPDLITRLRAIAATDPSPRVRREAAIGLAAVDEGAAS